MILSLKKEITVEIQETFEKLIDRKNFVFADPLLPFRAIKEANPHCTHLQIAQANPQAEICKRVQSCHSDLLISTACIF